MKSNTDLILKRYLANIHTALFHKRLLSSKNDEKGKKNTVKKAIHLLYLQSSETVQTLLEKKRGQM